MHRADDRRTGIVNRNMPNTSKAPAGGGDMFFQHVADGRAERQIGMSDDARANPGGAIATAVRHRSHAGDVFRFAERSSRLGPGRLVHGAAFGEHRGDDVVAGVEVLAKIIEAITPHRRVEEMMMRIDDRIVWIDAVSYTHL